jgi:hypothetical protein
MNLYYDDMEELRGNANCRKRSHADEEWKRWDDELVEDFSRWLNRVAKAFIIAVGIVSAAVVIRLF